MNVVREAPLPGASFGATLRLDGDAARIVAAAEADPGMLPAALADAKGLLLIQGMNGIADDPNLLIRLSRVFGPEVEDYRHNLTDLKAVHVSVPEILLVSNRAPVGKAPPKRPDPPLAADGLIPTQYPHRKGWHTDQSYRRPPPDISLFYAVTPAERTTGQTLFANGILAYEALPPALRAKVETLVGLHAQPGSGRSRDAALAGRTPRAFAVHRACGDSQGHRARAVPVRVKTDAGRQGQQTDDKRNSHHVRKTHRSYPAGRSGSLLALSSIG